MSPAVSIMFLFIGAFITFLAFRKELELSKKWTGFKSALIVAFVLFLFLGIWDIINKDSDSKKTTNTINDTIHSSSNTVRSAVDTVGAKVSKGFEGTDHKIDTGFKKLNKRNRVVYSAIIGQSTMPNAEKNPAITYISKNEDTIKVMDLFTNYGKGVAFNINATFLCVNINNGKIYTKNSPPLHSGNKSIAWQAIERIKYPYYFTLVLDNSYDSTFICTKIDFSDSVKGKKSYSNIFLWDKSSLGFKVIDNECYNKIEGFLKKKKYWKSPFKQ